MLLLESLFERTNSRQTGCYKARVILLLPREEEAKLASLHLRPAGVPLPPFSSSACFLRGGNGSLAFEMSRLLQLHFSSTADKL